MKPGSQIAIWSPSRRYLTIIFDTEYASKISARYSMSEVLDIVRCYDRCRKAGETPRSNSFLGRVVRAYNAERKRVERIVRRPLGNY